MTDLGERDARPRSRSMATRPSVTAIVAKTALLMACGLTVASQASVAVQAEVIDRVLAVVGGQIITLSDVRAALDFRLVDSGQTPDATASALQKLIDRELVLAEVRRYEPPEPQQSAIDVRLAAARARFSSDATYAAALSTSGLDEDRLRDLLKDELRIEAYLDERFIGAAQPTDDEVDTYLREHSQEAMANGRSTETARDFVRQRLTGERRTALITEWLEGLRRRADVTELDLASS